MTRKRTRRKPHQASTTSWAYAIAANWEMDQAHATQIMIKVRSAFERMKGGSTDTDDFDLLAGCINVGIVRSEKIDPLAVEYMLAGRTALEEADRIFGDHQRYGFTGQGLMNMGDALDLYEQLLRKSTPRQMQEATDESSKRERAQREAIR